MRPWIVGSICFAIAASCMAQPQVQKTLRNSEPPNIVLILLDDANYEYFSFMGDPLVQTPNIDFLMNNGYRFALGYNTTSVCRPSLATIASGQQPHNNLIRNLSSPDELSPTDLWPMILRDAGWENFIGGKWWEHDPNGALNPLYFGFTETEKIGTPEEGVQDFVRSGQQGLLDFIATVEEPFTVWWAPVMPHRPHNPPIEYLNQINPDLISVPPWITDVSGYRQENHRFMAMHLWVDDKLGDFLDAVENRGLMSNTLFITVNDNGTVLGYINKQSPYDQGIKTHISLTWPGFVPVGVNDTHIASTVDIAATILDFAGEPIPDSYEGVSLRPIAERRMPDRDIVCGANYSRYPLAAHNSPYFETPLAIYVRTLTHKYIYFLTDINEDEMGGGRPIRWKHKFLPTPERVGGSEELYNVVNDQWEQNDISGDPNNAAILEELRIVAFDCWYESGEGSNPCPADINYDGAVDMNDLSVLIADFGMSGSSRADVDNDGWVNLSDLSIMLATFGQSCQH